MKKKQKAENQRLGRGKGGVKKSLVGNLARTKTKLRMGGVGKEPKEKGGEAPLAAIRIKKGSSNPRLAYEKIRRRPVGRDKGKASTSWGGILKKIKKSPLRGNRSGKGLGGEK